MKYSIFLFLMLACYLQGQSGYLPMVKEGNHWYYDKFKQLSTYERITNSYVCWIEGDTTLNDTTYKILRKADLLGTEPCAPRDTPCFVPDIPYKLENERINGFIREDTVLHQVFFRSTLAYNFACWMPDFEYLIIDFDLKVGNQLTYCMDNSIVKVEDTTTYRIYKVDTVLYASKNRRALHFLARKPPIVKHKKVDNRIIEGVGLDMYEQFGGNGQYGNTNFVRLNHFCEGGTQDCSLPIAANKTIIRSDGKLYPNPVSDVATLIGISDIQSVTCYNLTGYRINIPRQNHTLDFSGVVPGIYFLKITGIDGSAAIIKVVKR